MDTRHLLRVNLLSLELSYLLTERLYPIKLEETPHSVPDRRLLLQIDPILYKPIQSFYENTRQGHADTLLNDLLRQNNRLYLKV